MSEMGADFTGGECVAEEPWAAGGAPIATERSPRCLGAVRVGTGGGHGPLCIALLAHGDRNTFIANSLCRARLHAAHSALGTSPQGAPQPGPRADLPTERPRPRPAPNRLWPGAPNNRGPHLPTNHGPPTPPLPAPAALASPSRKSSRPSTG